MFISERGAYTVFIRLVYSLLEEKNGDIVISDMLLTCLPLEKENAFVYTCSEYCSLWFTVTFTSGYTAANYQMRGTSCV